jgi:amino acid permease
VLWYGFTFTKIQPISHYPGFVTDTFPYFFSTAAFLYIQPSTLFPIANAMKEPKRFNIVSSVTYVFIAILNAAFATIAYMFFGDKTGTNRFFED